MNRLRYGLECLRMQGTRPLWELLAITVTVNGLIFFAGSLAIMLGVV